MASPPGPTTIAIPIFDGLTALDAVGPYEVLSRLPHARVEFVARTAGPKRTSNGMLTLVADEPLDALPAPDVIVVPGGPGVRRELTEERTLSWLRAAHAGARWTTSVCTGSLMLAAAGILTGIEATTHWLARDELERLGAIPLAERIVERGTLMTAAGVSAGIDMALRLAAHLAGDTAAEAIQLSIEYDPEPPYEAGSPERAPADVVELVSRGRRQRPSVS